MSFPKLFFALLLSSCCLLSIAQNQPPAKPGLFLDCNGTACDGNYLRSEINLVDFLNERTAADVHVLITALDGSGGTEQYQLIFYGQKRFNGYRDTLRFVTPLNATKAEKREQLLHYLKLGLVPLLAKTGYAWAVDVRLKLPGTGPAVPSTKDKWGYVVFNINAEGSLSADQNYTNEVGTGSFLVNRTTDKLRLQAGAYGSSYKYTYKVKDSAGTTKYEVNNTDFGVQHYLVAAVSRHFSMGYLVRYSGNTFQNLKRKVYFNPVLELNLFSYADINNRSFLIRYGADVTSFAYHDTTLYNKLKETLYGHEASVSINFNQKWGSFSSGMYYRNYFADPALYSTGANLTFNIRIAGGLSFYVSGNGNIIHDQVYLQKGGATEQEILIRKRQLESSFDYFTSVGVNFRFGSKLNSFVNQRIGGYRGF